MTLHCLEPFNQTLLKFNKAKWLLFSGQLTAVNETRIVYHFIIVLPERNKKQKMNHLQTYPTTFVAAATRAHAIILDGMPSLKKMFAL